MSADLGDITARVSALRARYQDRDMRMAEVQAVRRGNFQAIAPDLFSEKWARPIVANMIDTAARDAAAVLAPLPSFNCSAASGLNETAKRFADRRTKIARGYVAHSKLERQMQTGADQYNSYGMLVLCVEPDFKNNTPRISIEDAIGAYPVWDRWGNTVEFARVFYRDWLSLVADYPKLKNARDPYGGGGSANNKVEVVKYVSREGRVVMYLPSMGDFLLEDIDSGLGRCYYECIQRPGLDDEIRGAYDDVIWVQLARHRIQMLLMEGIDKSVRAPLVVTPDVGDIALGPDAIITAQGGPNSVGRANLTVPAQAFGAVQQLKEEQQVGSMSPQARSGNVDASVITGQGVQQLLGGWNTQIASGQTAIKGGLHCAIMMCFEMDEKLFGNVQKELRGNDAGVPYSIKYTPIKDIDGDHTVEITYGFAAGLDPNRALVFLLQADGAGLVSKDYVRRSLPVDLNAVDEEKKIVVEKSREALVQAFSALAQSIPQMVAAGQDPTQLLSNHAEFIRLVLKDKTVEEAVSQVLAPKPPPGVSSPGAQPPPGPDSAPGGPTGFTPQGLPAGLKSGIATEGQGGRPDLQQFFAGLTSGGNPNLSSGVSRFNPVGT